MNSLFKRFYLLAFIVVVVITAGFYAQYMNSRVVINENARKIAAASASVLSVQIESWLSQQAAVVEAAGDFVRLERWKPADIDAYLRQLLAANPAFSSLYFTSTENEMINASGWQPPPGFDLRKRTWYVRATEENQLIITETFLNASKSDLIITVAKPVYGLHGGLLGVVGGDVSVRTVMKYVTDQKIGETGFAYLVDGNDALLVHPRLTDFRDAAPPLSGEYMRASRLAEQSDTGLISAQLEGHDGFLDFRPIMRTRWKLGSFVSLDDLALAEQQIASGFFLALMVSMLVLFSMFYLLNRFVVKPLSGLNEGIGFIDPENLSAYRLPVPATSELAAVAHTVNRLIDKAGSYMDELERKVDERTQDLRGANQELNAMNEELTAVNEQLTSMNKEVAALNKALGELNESLELRVQERTGELRSAMEMQSVLRQVSEITLHEMPMEQIFAEVHHLVRKVLPARNFYVSLLDETQSHYFRPYCSDETGSIPQISPVGEKRLTDYVLRRRQAVYLATDDLNRLQQQGELMPGRARYSVWLGVPLLDSMDRPMGVMAAFSMDSESKALKEQHLDALTIIAAQVSQALERKKAAKELKKAEERFRLAMDFSGTGYMDVDLQHRKLLLSGNWRTRLGLADGGAEMEWDRYLELVHPDDAEKRQKSLDDYLAGSIEIHATEYRLKMPDSSWIWVLGRFKAVRDPQGNPVRLLGTLSDISALRQREEQERFRAEHDELTGMLNRQGLTVRADEVFEAGEGCVLALIDVDDFDLINAVHGRDVGDQYLVAFSAFLRQAFGSDVHIARYGGDEFILLFPGQEARRTATEAFAALDSVWIETNAGGFYVHMSCGMAECPEGGCDLDWLVQQADLALKHAKDQGKRRVRFFESSMLDAVGRRHVIREQLNEALARNEHYLVFQPIFHIRGEADGAAGYEALLRWDNPLLGKISPADFIPVAETTGLILPIGKWVLEQACQFSIECQQRTGQYVTVAVNLSALQLAQPGFVAMVCGILAQCRLPAEFLQLEVTESVLMTDLEKNAAILSELRRCGIGIALDDFGTGYSSFTYLAQLPISTLKIDRSLIAELSGEYGNKNQALLKAVLLMANLLGHEVVVEGVETAEQLATLRQIGFGLAQGYLLGKPMPGEYYLVDS